MDRRYLAAVGTIVGTLVGAGILALPYAVSKSGFLIGFLLLVIVGAASILMTMYTGELSFKSKRMHQLPILISRYTNKHFGLAVLLLQILTIYGAVVAYLIAIGISLSLLMGLPFALSILLVFVLSTPLILRGYATVEAVEMPLSLIKLGLIVAISIPLLLTLSMQNLSTIHPDKALFSFGIILFSLTAFTVVPEVKAELRGRKEQFNSVIVASVVISIAVYLLFTAAFLGVFGVGISEIATNSVSSTSFSYIFYVVTIFIVVTPYLALSLVLVDSLNYDFKIGRLKSFALAMFIPLVISLTNMNFAYVLDVIGGLFLPLLAIMVLVAVVKERKLPGAGKSYRVPGGMWLIAFTGAVMIVGMVYTVVYVI
jgi:amino acid permease